MTTKSQSPAIDSSSVLIPIGRHALAGDLVVPPGARGIALFAHGSGSSRHSPRNRFVARQLQQAGVATLLMDLLTEDEELVDEASAGSLRFDIGLLAERLDRSSDWVKRRPAACALPMGYFGASTGAAAALLAAAGRRDVMAVVSRGGRPDLAEGHLGAVTAPTLLIVGGDDDAVIALNRKALDELTCVKRLEIVSGATHLFEEPGALERVAALAADWFHRHLHL